MANAKKCDKCGKFYANHERKFRINNKDFKNANPAWIKLVDVNDHYITSFDLCEQCMKDLWHWLCNEEACEENE